MAAKKKAKAKKPAKKKAAKAKKAAPKKAAAAKAAPAVNPWKSYAANLAREAATTLKVLRAFPAGQDTFQPHPRSSTAVQLVSTFAVEQALVVMAIDGTLKMGGGFPPPYPTLTTAIAAFEQAVNGAVSAANKAPASTYTRGVEFYTAPRTVGMVPAGALAEMMLADQIHHRGQLSVYVRMAGGKVPSIYGPSADEPWS